MTLWEDTFKKTPKPQPVPVLVDLGQSFQNSEITAIRIQDVARAVWYSWDKNSTYPNGYWDNSGGQGTNAPAGETPQVTPGKGNLYVAFYAVNNGSPGYVSLQIYTYGTTQASQLPYLNTGQGGGVEWTGDMSTTPLPIALMSS